MTSYQDYMTIAADTEVSARVASQNAYAESVEISRAQSVEIGRSEHPEIAFLDNYAKSVRVSDRGGSEKASEARENRWAAMRALWLFSSLPRVRKCKRVTVRPMGTVDVRKTSSGASGSVAVDSVGFAGLATCGSVWACPICSARIQAVRRLELGVLVATAKALGYTVAFGTVTLRHKRGQSLQMLWESLNKANRGVTNATRVKRLRKELGRVGYVRATEVTYGRSGWHPHIHSIQLFKGDVTAEQLQQLADAEFAVWERQAANLGLGKPLRDFYDLRLVTDARVEFADYFAKSVYDASAARSARSMSFEMQGNATKRARSIHGRTPFQILADVVDLGDAEDLDLWEEYERASKGRRALVWSPGLRDLLKIEEVSDEDIAEESIGDEDDVLFVVADWSPIAANPRLGGQLLAAVQHGGMVAGRAFCDAHGIITLDADDEEAVEDRRLYASAAYGEDA